MTFLISIAAPSAMRGCLIVGMLCIVGGVLGCSSIVHPDGYETLSVMPSREVSYNQPVDLSKLRDPMHYTNSDGETITLTMHNSVTLTGPGYYRSEMRYDVELGEHKLSCATMPDVQGAPETRFGCWSRDHNTQVWVAPGANCEFRNMGFFRTEKRPECWRGDVHIGTRPYTFAYSDWKKWPVGRLAWFDDKERIVQAAEFDTWRFRYWQSVEADESQSDHELLLLSAFALFIWDDQQDP